MPIAQGKGTLQAEAHLCDLLEARLPLSQAPWGPSLLTASDLGEADTSPTDIAFLSLLMGSKAKKEA